MMRAVIAVCLALVAVPSRALTASAPSPEPCTFVRGFQIVHDLNPQLVGGCLDDERATANCDVVQHTTNGLLVWRKSDGYAAFTDGSNTRLLARPAIAPAGLVERPNACLGRRAVLVLRKRRTSGRRRHLHAPKLTSKPGLNGCAVAGRSA